MKSLKCCMHDEIDRSLKEPCKKIHVDLFRFWEENTETYPTISKTAEKVLSISASSAAVERLKNCSVMLEKIMYIAQKDVVLVTLTLNNLSLLDQILSIKKINSYSNGL